MTTATNFTAREEQSSHFTISSRKLVAQGSDVYVKEFTLAEKEEIPWHSHSNIFDIFYCIQGHLRVERIEISTGNRQPDMELNVGDSGKVDVGTAHRPFNPGPGPCRFINVQGVGTYDYLPYTPV
ncbi:MAG TPA: cupin domain-containing protein [Paralcaligenes sp.]|jgi:mannose-6-phosphate isomerase-like protein (cupin superfamily)